MSHKIQAYVTTKGGVVVLNGPFPIDKAEQIKNLCDAAPDLLEACELALQLRGLECTILTADKYQPYEKQKFRDESREIEEKIRAAIAKAQP